VSDRSGALILKRFPKQRYSAMFNPHTGFFARIEDVGVSEPFWAHHGPELLDIAITNWCDRGCFFCYRKSNEAGQHMRLDDYRIVISQAKDMHAFQVALGGGNPNQHPDFEEILRITREDFGIVPNYTTNGRGLTDSVLEATKRYCGAVAVSAYAPYTETSTAIERLTKHGITTNVHFILSSRSIDTAISWLCDPPRFLTGAHALVFLNYKPVGRHPDERLLANRSNRLEEFFRLATTARLPWRIGFDTCTITGLARYGQAENVSLEGCDAGRFSLFVSEELKVYPCSFMVEAGYEGVPLRGTTLREIWQNHPAFVQIRAQHAKGGCVDCQTREHCLSGCPLFPQMNLCPSNCRSEGDTESRASQSSPRPRPEDQRDAQPGELIALTRRRL
jgi:radical SAM protein with 4Fe4S-binding SPASM domain